MAAEEERRSWEERGQKNENQKTRGRKMENEETRGREKENEEERQSRLSASLSEVEDLSSYFRKHSSIALMCFVSGVRASG